MSANLIYLLCPDPLHIERLSHTRWVHWVPPWRPLPTSQTILSTGTESSLMHLGVGLTQHVYRCAKRKQPQRQPPFPSDALVPTLLWLSHLSIRTWFLHIVVMSCLSLHSILESGSYKHTTQESLCYIPCTTVIWDNGYQKHKCII